jgi:hypothetical protein
VAVEAVAVEAVAVEAVAVEAVAVEAVAVEAAAPAEAGGLEGEAREAQAAGKACLGVAQGVMAAEMGAVQVVTEALSPQGAGAVGAVSAVAAAVGAALAGALWQQQLASGQGAGWHRWRILMDMVNSNHRTTGHLLRAAAGPTFAHPRCVADISLSACGHIRVPACAIS